MFKLKNLFPLLVVAGALFILPACGKKTAKKPKKASTLRRDYRRKKVKKIKKSKKGRKSKRNKKSRRRRRSFLFRK